MSVICQDTHRESRTENAQYQIFTKGSPELILQRCDLVQTAGQSITLQPEHRQQILEQNDQLAAKGCEFWAWLTSP